MIKAIIKEMIIMIILLIAIILGLGVLLYDYIPSSKIVPTVLQYETPNNISEELSEKLIDEKEEVIITYQVDSKDLNIYEKTKDYNAGNPNPFSYYTTGVTPDNNNNNSDTQNSTNDGTFFENKGTK